MNKINSLLLFFPLILSTALYTIATEIADKDTQMVLDIAIRTAAFKDLFASIQSSIKRCKVSKKNGSGRTGIL
jgi:hypothetical protein